MKPTYNSILEDFIDLVERSEIQYRKLKYVAVTKEEYDSIKYELQDICKYPEYNKDKILGTLYGVTLVGYAYEYKIKKEELRDKLRI